MDNRNKEIRQFIDDMPDDYGFSKDDAKYISGYEGCPVPPFIYNSLIQSLVKEHYPFIDIITNSSSTYALCYGYGSLAVLSNTNCAIKSWQEEYYCFRVTQAIHYDKVVTGDQEVIFRNMADYFTNYKGNNFKFHIAVIFPHETDYHKVDADTRFSNLSSFAYYTLRGAFFLRDKGVLFSIVPKQYAYEINNNKELLKELNVVISITNEGEYSIIKIKK